MVWLGRLRGLKVIFDTKCIGRVVQGCIDDSLCALDGIWIDRAFLGVRFISAEHICVIGASSVIVDYKGEHLRMKPSSLLVRAVSTDGRRMGAITDAAIDEKTFSVACLSLIRSWPEKLTGKTETISAFKYDPLTDRVIILPDDSKTEVQSL